jgi:hypothetical protein
MGGGHGFHTSKFGLGADQILSLELVTADGRFITADPSTNTDLFWALRGGGGSEFQVSFFVKLYILIINNRYLGYCHFSNCESLRYLKRRSHLPFHTVL